tara:strand:+ start:225 stop:440 length:216 start_codon:yes stop_codon:yes gene_type:complete
MGFGVDPQTVEDSLLNILGTRRRFNLKLFSKTSFFYLQLVFFFSYTVNAGEKKKQKIKPGLSPKHRGEIPP